MTIFPEIFRYTFPLAQPQSAHAWTLASLKASVSEHYVIRICASVEILTANPIKLKKRRVTCLVMITHMKSVVDSWHFPSIGRVRVDNMSMMSFLHNFPSIIIFLQTKACERRNADSYSRQLSHLHFKHLVTWALFSLLSFRNCGFANPTSASIR